MVAAVSSVFAGIVLEGKSVADPRLMSLHQLASQAFLVGTVCLVLAAGASGWLRSKRLGVLSAASAAATLVAVVSILAPFLRFSEA
jgi:hypothetical protein